MDKKTFSILGGIFLFLCIAASYPFWISSIPFGKKALLSDELGISAFVQATTDAVTIEKRGEETKILTKENGLWKANGFEASKREIETFFNVLSGVTIELLVSRNPENHKNFEITDQQGTVLSFSRQNATSTFIVGKQGAAPDSFYIKSKESNAVYLATGSLAKKVFQESSAWRDTTKVNQSVLVK